jgi:hypothetical protein
LELKRLQAINNYDYGKMINQFKIEEKLNKMAKAEVYIYLLETKMSEAK